MAFSTDNIGKNCYINVSEDENIEDSLYGTIIGYYSDDDEEYYFISINGNVKRIYDDSLVNIVDDGGGGGAVTSVNGKTGVVLLDAEDVGAAPAETTVTVDGATPTITPEDKHIYNCGELTSLTIDNPPATGKYRIVFFSGATPTTTVGIENFVAEANKRYKITVEDNYATYDSWPYTPT